MKILVTGAAGFIGARFVQSCRERGGHEIVSVDEPAYFKDRPEHAGIDFGEIIARDRLLGRLDANPPRLDAIVHLGACTDTTMMDERLLQELNVGYTQRLWEHATRKKIPFVHASSVATYGDGSLGYDDAETLIPKLHPLNPYGESKRVFDQWALEQEGLGHAPPIWSGWKFFNVYGFGEAHKGRMASVVLHAYQQLSSKGVIRLSRSHRSDIADGHQARD